MLDTIENGQYGAVWSMGHTQQVCVRIVLLPSNVWQQFFGRSAFLRQQETDLPPAELWCAWGFTTRRKAFRLCRDCKDDSESHRKARSQLLCYKEEEKNIYNDALIERKTFFEMIGMKYRCLKLRLEILMQKTPIPSVEDLIARISEAAGSVLDRPKTCQHVRNSMQRHSGYNFEHLML
ncbi:hypothetical protein TNCV_4360801 [Trichonephila clavipes]|nr:hypothetical protein TNCV_4360801 [Trichonephila clavipes]